MKNAVLTVVIIAAIAAAQVTHAEETGKFSLETGMDYNTGNYGGTQSTDVTYIPFAGKYQGKSWTLKLTVPYLQITGPGNVINVINGVAITPDTAINSPVTRSGLGDVIAAATHNIYNGATSGLLVNLTGKIKFGTADRTQGMGTGENDYSVQSDIFQTSGKLTTFGTLGYRVYGSPPGYALSNAIYGSLGGSYRFGQETNGGLMLDVGQKITTTGSTHAKSILFANHKLDKNWKAQGYMLKGFTNSVPDWGIGTSVAYLF